MNNLKKVATAVVAMVMAGTMVFSLAACNNNNTSGGGGGTGTGGGGGGNTSGGGGGEGGTNIGINKDPVDYWTEAPNLESSLTPKLDNNGKLTYTSQTELRLNVGNSDTQTTAFTSTEISGEVTLPDGKTYGSTNLKPAWAAMSTQLDLKFTDSYVKDDRIGTSVTSNKLSDYDVITGSLADAVNYADSYLNLNDYIYYMPNYKAFLMKNQVTLWSLTGNSTDGAMYAAPYFDGNDDIEKYELVRKDWVKIILDSQDVSAATTTYKAQAEAKAAVDATVVTATTAPAAESYMGKTGNWTIETTDAADTTKTTTVKVDYDAALNAAKTSGSALNTALTAAGVTTSSLTSGNIVDLQNAAITAKSGAVTGAQLIAILRAYIDVAYTTEAGAKFYATRSDVFNSVSAAWDVDLLVAMLRCVVTSQNLFDSTISSLGSQYFYGLMARQGTTQRRVDLQALAGELYGVRGMESRYEYTYIDNQGNLQDARADADSYELIANMGKLAKEGLIYTGNLGTDGKNSYVNSNSVTSTDGAVAFMTHDYVQTQTRYTIDGLKGADSVPEGYEFAPIVTPVSKWDIDGDGEHTDIMRFTESWRSVKNTGFSIPKVNVTNNPDKLSAVLAFIDYLFSSDGQLLMTYGTRSDSATNPNGWWYCNESNLALDTVAEKTVDATNYSPAQYTVKDEYKQQVFVYQGKVYEGLKYADRCVPIMTDASKQLFLGQTVGGIYLGMSGFYNGIAVAGNYTNYARYIIGTTLPIGNKDQGFEYQCTSAQGLAGAAIVATAINNGTIKHVKINLADLSGEEGFWYLIAPTALPLSASDRQTFTNSEQTLFTSTFFYNNSGTTQRTNVYIDLLFYGLNDANHNICGQSTYGLLKANGAAYVSWLTGIGLSNRIQILQNSWIALDTHYDITGLGA